MNIKDIVSANPIIAATELKEVKRADESKASAMILMNAKLTELMDMPKPNKPYFLHTDLLKGLSNDKEGIAFLSEYIKPTGIVTTKSTMLSKAKKEGLLAIQRVFLIDTSSLKTAIQHIKDNQPDAIEVMPGIATSIVQVLKTEFDIPLILAGLISTQDQICNALHAGADAVSLSNQSLWNEQPLRNAAIARLTPLQNNNVVC